MIRTRALASIGMVLASAVLPAASLSAETPAPAVAAAHSTPFNPYPVWQTFKIYCMTCHVGPRAPAGLNLQALDLENLDHNGAAWEKLIRKLKSRDMPPAGVPRPDGATYEAMV